MPPCRFIYVSKGTKLEIPILLGAFYGLRRSEAIGLKWEAVDFEHDTITVKHTVTSVNLDGKHILVPQDTTKTKSSRRTLPLVPFVKERLLSLQKEQKENLRLCGRCYYREYEDYICVNEIGDLIKPEDVSSTLINKFEQLSKIKAAYAETHSDYNKDSIFIPLLSHIKENSKLFLWLLSEFDYDYRKRSIEYKYEKYFKPLCENLYENEQHKMYCFIGFHSSLVSCLKYWIERGCLESEEEIAGIIVECIPEKLREPALEGNNAEQI